MTTSSQLATLDDLMAHARWTRRMAVRLLGDPDDADDVVQETWLSALRLPPRRQTSLRPWLATVVRNLVRSRVRTEARARRRADSLVSASESVSASSPEQLLSQLETERLIATLVMNLAEPYRRTVLLRYHQGKSSAEIAAEEGVAEGTVRWRLKQGLDQIRREFEERAGGRDVARGVLVPLAALASAATVSKGALAATAPVLLLKGNAAVTAAVAAVAAVVSAGVVVEHAREQRQNTADTASVSRRAPRGTGPRRPVSPATLALLPRSEPPPPPPSSPTWPPPIDPASLAGGSQLFGDARAANQTPLSPPPPQTLPAPPAPIPPPSPKAAARGGRTVKVGPTGAFTFDSLPPGRFSITAQVPGRPSTKMTMQVDGLRRGGKVTVSITPPAGSSPEMAVTITPSPDSGTYREVSTLPPAQSRWCCHRAISVGQAVEGRACLKLASDDLDSECEVYGLKREVRCWNDYTEGAFATGDLSRTGRLICEGQAL